MKLVVAVDDRGGMAFNNRRVSRDKLLVGDLAKYIKDSTLYIEPYSEELFAGEDINVILSSDPLKFAEDEDFVFVERYDITPYLNLACEIIVYKWNRRYPFDLAMKEMPDTCGFKLDSVCEFKGNSHEKITREIYKR